MVYSGDISNGLLHPGSQDGIIDVSDYTVLLNAMGQILIGISPEDITGDNVVESTDFLLIENNFDIGLTAMHP
jgi:hypothetical protein